MDPSTWQGLLSPRTRKYVQAMIREGDNFDRAAWLKRVRDEELAAEGFKSSAAPDDTNRDNSESQKSAVQQTFGQIRQVPAVLPARPPIRQVPRRAVRRSIDQSAQDLAKLEGIWRATKLRYGRNAIFSYLTAVFDLIARYRQHKQLKKLIRCALKLSGLPANTDPFALIIRCTCDPSMDRKTISRWSRALRYVRERKPPEASVKIFMQAKGGINACADRFARMRKHRAGE